MEEGDKDGVFLVGPDFGGLRGCHVWYYDGAVMLLQLLSGLGFFWCNFGVKYVVLCMTSAGYITIIARMRGCVETCAVEVDGREGN